MAVMIGQCRCENSELSNFWIIVNPYGQNEFWGICCKRRLCNSEYLIERFTNDVAEIDVTVCGIPLYFKSASDFVTDPDFQANPNRELITYDNFTSVQRGDHLGFERSSGYWHHAIVEKVGQQSLIVIGWGGNFSNLSIRKENLAGSSLNCMWKFRYSSEEEEQNPADLVVARAKSRLSQSRLRSFRLFVWDELDEGYGLFNQNCETLALYCKLGFTSTQLGVLIFRQRVAASWQLPWLRSQVCDITVKVCLTSGKLIAAFLKLIPTAFARLLSAKTLKNVFQFLKNHESYFKVTGFSVVVITEVISFYKFKQKIDTRREQNPENNEAHDQEFMKQCIESLLTIGLCGFMRAVMSISDCPLSVEIILNLILMVLCKKLLLPKLISDFIKWLENDSASFSHILRQPMVA